MQHDGTMAGSERDVSAHRAMQEESGAKETEPGNGGGEGGHIQGLQCVWTPPGYGDLFQIRGSVGLSGKKLLTGGIQKPAKGTGGV